MPALSRTLVANRRSGAAGTGLRNTRERLTLLYGAQSQFQIARTGPRETVVSFNVTGDCLNDA